MIERITVNRFKSYRSAELQIAPLTLLVGANASGKSNLIEAIRFLSWLAHGRRLDDILDRVQETDLAIRGSLETLLYDQADGDTFSLGCSLAATGEWRNLMTTIRLAEGSEMRIVAEDLRSPHTKVPLYEIKQPAGTHSREVAVAYNNFARGGRKPTIPCSDRQAIFTQLDVPSRFTGRARKIIPEVVGRYQEALREILFLDPSPRRMGGYSSIVDRKLRGDGANLSSVLYDLCARHGRKRDVLGFIRSLPEQDIADIEFLKTPRNEVVVQLRETFGGSSDHRVALSPEYRDASVLSDGTLRVLAVAAALFSAPEGSMVIIEEVDNGIHPSRAETILRHIRETAEERRLRVLITSHNPALADTLPPKAVPDVVACYRDPVEGDSRLVRLDDLSSYPELVARGPLGQLMTRGVLDRFLKEQKSEDEKVLNAKEWLRSFQREVERV